MEILVSEPPPAGNRILVAGIGNVFFGDDGFGVEVATRLLSETLPECVRIADYGIRGLHLAYELLDGNYKTTILVDAMPRGGKPGTVYLMEPDMSAEALPDAVSPDAHQMTPRAIFQWLESLGGVPGRVLVVGCEPASAEEEMGLSPPVALAVDEAVRLILDLVREETGGILQEKKEGSS